MSLKRSFDVTLVLLASVAWVPVLASAALANLIFSGRPVFYRSKRWVRTGEMVSMVKFRTMVRNAEQLINRETVPVQNVRFLNVPPDSPVYTRFGKVLERLGITEIPQLLHVLRGEMSVVGNRPLPENVMQCLREEYTYADDRFLTRAGLTGPAQLVGRDKLSDSERLHLESAYCRAALQSYRLRLDFTILLSTVLIVLHLRKSYDYHGVLDLIERNSKHPVTAPGAEKARPAVRKTDGVVVD